MTEWECTRIQSRTPLSFSLWGDRVSFILCESVPWFLSGFSAPPFTWHTMPRSLELCHLSAPAPPANTSQSPNSKFQERSRWLVQLGWGVHPCPFSYGWGLLKPTPMGNAFSEKSMADRPPPKLCTPSRAGLRGGESSVLRESSSRLGWAVTPCQEDPK